MAKKILWALWVATLALSSTAALAQWDAKACTYNGIPLKGRVQIVNSFPDVKVQVVTSFPDLKVQTVQNFADSCGKWEFVQSFPDFKIQFVESFPDVKIEFVQSFPGAR